MHAHGKAFVKYKWKRRLKEVSLLFLTTRRFLSYSPHGPKNNNHSNNSRSYNIMSTDQVPRGDSAPHMCHPRYLMTPQTGNRGGCAVSTWSNGGSAFQKLLSCLVPG